ncbi:MAG TPA: two-component regulator propeller domain-containing protein [Blastocatellia bacterium]|nr:two-component regulator propeller domain-containing protein [Blastocatellia bacterium]
MSTLIPNRTASNNRAGKGLLLAVFLVFSLAVKAHLASPQAGGQSGGGAIIGVIQDDRGAPLANAKVTLTSGDLLSSISTQADGKFEFHNLKPAQYRITVEAARFRKEAVTVTLRPDETFATQPVKLTPSSLHVAVLDAGSQPLAGVTVSLYAKDRAAVGALAARSVTDAYGDAYFGKLAPGSFQLSAALRGYDEYRNDVFISSGITTEFPLQLLVAPVIPINEKAVSRYTVPNLPSKNVQAVFQDSEGWMWFGTDKGVARFNGAEFKSSAVAGSAFEQLAGEEVRSIAEDRSGTIWIVTARSVRRIAKSGEDAGPSFDVQDPRQVFVDSGGAVWVAGALGLSRFDGRGLIPSAHSRELPSDDVRALAEDKDGSLWIATANGVSILEAEKLISFQRWRESRGARNQPEDQVRVGDARSIFVDDAGRVWLATASELLLIEKGSMQRPAIEAMRSVSGSRGGSLRAIGADFSGRMWFAVDAGGVVVYDPARRESQRVNFLDRDHVAAIFTSREGNVWFATDNGVISSDFYSFVSFTTSRGLADNDVQQVVVAPGVPGSRGRGSLWFLTRGGVSRLEGERIVPVEGFRTGISVQAVAFDRGGSAWFATDQGGLRWTGETLTQFNEGSGLASNSVQWVSAIAGGSAVVFATTRGASVFRDGSLHNIEAIAGYDVRHVFEDGDGRLWFATARGVVSIDAKGDDLIDTSRGLADNDVRSIIRFNDRLLVATRAGVQAYTGSTFTTVDAEPTNTMFVDRDGYLWTGTDEGRVKKLFQFGGHLLSTVYSGEAHALTGSRINSISQDSEGRIWIATNKGAVRHMPVAVAPLAQISLEVDGRAQQVSESGSCNVPYGRHRLIFHFTAASMSGQARYVYRINSGDGEQPWEVLPMQQGAERDVSRLDLDEGAHTFELIALNRDLYGAMAPAATLSLRVGSPFWKSWWFYAVTIAVIGLALGAAFVVRRFGDREYVLPRELRTFVPIEPNPFIVGNPIRTEKMFYGREDDFRYVRTKLEGTNQGVVIVFCGERRAGKSSILYQVAGGRLGERFIPVFVDLQEMVIASDSEFFSRISRLIAEAVARANNRAVTEAAASHGSVGAVGNVALAGGGPAGGARPPALAQTRRIRVPEFDGRNPYPVFLDFLDEVLASIGGRTLLILMDEYELLEGKVDEGKLSNELFTFLAGLMDNKERLALIFTGSRRLEERDRKYWRELLRRSLFRKVGFLSEKDTVRLITEPVEGRVVYGRGVMDLVYRLTAGQPFYTQVICQNVVDYMNEHRQNWVTVADLGHVITDIVDNPLPQMIYSWDALSDDEKLGLSLLGEVLTDGIAYATAGQLRASVKANDYPVNLSENTIRLTLEEMFRRELLEKDPADGFRFKIDLLRLWIRRSHSIWQVVKEVRTL